MDFTFKHKFAPDEPYGWCFKNKNWEQDMTLTSSIQLRKFT